MGAFTGYVFTNIATYLAGEHLKTGCSLAGNYTVIQKTDYKKEDRDFGVIRAFWSRRVFAKRLQFLVSRAV